MPQTGLGVADARTKYASRLTEIANRMLNHTFILNTYKLGQQDIYITAKEIGEAFTNDDDATISKFLNKLGL